MIVLGAIHREGFSAIVGSLIVFALYKIPSIRPQKKQNDSFIIDTSNINYSDSFFEVSQSEFTLYKNINKPQRLILSLSILFLSFIVAGKIASWNDDENRIFNLSSNWFIWTVFILSQLLIQNKIWSDPSNSSLTLKYPTLTHFSVRNLDTDKLMMIICGLAFCIMVIMFVVSTIFSKPELINQQ